MQHAIDVRGVSRAYGRHHVLAGIDLAVAPGEIFALLGPNGAGKTTMISLLTTLLRPDSGSITVAGCDAVHDPDAVRRRIALTGQSAAVDDMLTGSENVTMIGRLSGLSGREARARTAELLARFNLVDAAHRRVGSYSGGMRRRLDLALSFVVTPGVLFLDEPTTGLDTRSRRELWQVIRGLADFGTTVFLTTQYLEEADHIADRVAILHEGRVAVTGTPAQLKARVGGTTVEVRDATGELTWALPTDGTVAGLRRALDELVESGGRGDVSLRRPTLDDVFLAITETITEKEPA